MTRLDEIAARLDAATLANGRPRRSRSARAKREDSWANFDLLLHAPGDLAALLDLARKAQEFRRLYRANSGRWNGAVADAYDALFDAIAALEAKQ